jgi:hypothetical protein
LRIISFDKDTEKIKEKISTTFSGPYEWKLKGFLPLEQEWETAADCKG